MISDYKQYTRNALREECVRRGLSTRGSLKNDFINRLLENDRLTNNSSFVAPALPFSGQRPDPPSSPTGAPAQVGVQPHPNASCITPAPAKQPTNQDLRQRNQVASTLDVAPNAEGDSPQVSDRDILRAINANTQAQRETNEVFSGQLSQHNTQIARMQQNQIAQGATQIAQGATIDQHGQQLTAQGATVDQHGQRISATEVAQATQTKAIAQTMGIAQVALLTAQKASKDKKGLLGCNSDPLQRTGNPFDTPLTRSNGTDIEGSAAAGGGGGPFQGAQKDLFGEGSDLKDPPESTVSNLPAAIVPNEDLSDNFDRLRLSHADSLLPLALAVRGEREFVEAEKAREFVASWTEELTAHRQKVQAILGDTTTEGGLGNVVLCDRIRLSDKSFSDEAADIIAAFLKEPFMGGRSIASGILYAELDDIIAGRMTEMGLHVLQTICDAFADAKLVDVNLSDNAIGQQGIGACNTVLSKPSLERLALCNNGLSVATMEQVADILTNDTSGTGCVATNLTKIHFYNNMSGEGGCRQFARILEKSSKLTDIRFSSTRAGRDGSDIVASALDVALEEGRNANLEKLDLCDNNFGNKASQDALFRALGCTASLSYLDLRDCELEDDGVKKVCHALVGSDSALEHLDLSGNTVKHRGAKQIANYIRDSGGKLKGLCLDDNDLTSKGVVHIASAFHGSGDGHAIERLQLNCTACGAIGARALIEAFGPGGKSGAELTKICLDGNYFKEDVVGELGHAFNDVLVEMEENNSDGEEEDDNKGEEEDDNKLCYACKGDGHSCRTCDGDGELKAKSDCYTCSGDGYVLGDMNQRYDCCTCAGDGKLGVLKKSCHQCGDIGCENCRLR